MVLQEVRDARVEGGFVRARSSRGNNGDVVICISHVPTGAVASAPAAEDVPTPKSVWYGEVAFARSDAFQRKVR